MVKTSYLGRSSAESLTSEGQVQLRRDAEKHGVRAEAPQESCSAHKDGGHINYKSYDLHKI